MKLKKWKGITDKEMSVHLSSSFHFQKHTLLSREAFPLLCSLKSSSYSSSLITLCSPHLCGLYCVIVFFSIGSRSSTLRIAIPSPLLLIIVRLVVEVCSSLIDSSPSFVVRSLLVAVHSCSTSCKYWFLALIICNAFCSCLMFTNYSSWLVLGC